MQSKRVASSTDRDSLRIGQSDVERGRRFKFKNDDWEDSRGYQHWMGDKGRYKHEYRGGYERGYRQAYNSYGYRRDRDDSTTTTETTGDSVESKAAGSFQPPL